MIKQLTLRDIDITGGFWQDKIELVREVTVWNVYKRFKETGRFEAFKHNWKEGQPNRPHIFWDSDVAKWIEGAAYLIQKKPEPELEAIIDEVVDDIERNRMKDGYFNSYFTLIEPENRFKFQGHHELYCAGHLLEASIAYKDATGKDKFFNLMKDYMDLIYDIFYVNKSAAFHAPGHEEIELALVKLYRHTGELKYLNLARYFVRIRGYYPEEGNPGDQTDKRILDMERGEGHSVRACYYYSAAADIARDAQDKEIGEAVKRIFKSIAGRQMYITGAIGSTRFHEAFDNDYFLPNVRAYAETCANLSLAMFARRMSVLEPDSLYADVAERVLYNSFISGMSLDGKAFFYSNMQENRSDIRNSRTQRLAPEFLPAPQRVEVFECSCCPPNVVRAIPSIADYQYTYDEEAETLWCHQFMTSEASVMGRKVKMKTDYPYNGDVNVTWSGRKGILALRLPGWMKSYSITVNGKEARCDAKSGYLYVKMDDGDILEYSMDIPVTLNEASPLVSDDAGRVAISRGPLIYCIEGVDYDGPIRDLRFSEGEPYVVSADEELGVPVIRTSAYRRIWKEGVLYAPCADLEKVQVQLIPYFAFANRGETDLLIWTIKK